MSANTTLILSRNFGPVLRAAVVFSLCASAAGCDQAAAKAKEEAQRRVQPTYDKASGKLTKLAYDSNDNGKPDTWAFMDGARLVRRRLVRSVGESHPVLGCHELFPHGGPS